MRRPQKITPTCQSEGNNVDKNSIAICIRNKSKLQNQILIPKQFQTCLQSSKFEIVEAPSHSHFVVIYISTLLNLHASKFQGAETIIDTMVLLCAFVSTNSNLHASRFEFWKQTWIVVLVWFPQFGTYMQVSSKLGKPVLLG